MIKLLMIVLLVILVLNITINVCITIKLRVLVLIAGITAVLNWRLKMPNLIVTKKKPAKPEDCHFAEYIESVDKYKCRLQPGIISRCDIDMGEKCRMIKVRKEK